MLTKKHMLNPQVLKKILGYLTTSFLMWSPNMYGLCYTYAWDSNGKLQLTSEVMPVTMKQQTIWIFSHLQLASFQYLFFLVLSILWH
jgi:hypothetical protein